jgi:hypothetical protein
MRPREREREPGALGLLLVVLSSNAISADAGYRSPRESKRRGPAIDDEQVGSVLAARVSVPSVTLPTGCLWKKPHQGP